MIPTRGFIGLWLLALSATCGCDEDARSPTDTLDAAGVDSGGSSVVAGGNEHVDGGAQGLGGEASGAGGEGGDRTAQPLELLQSAARALVGSAAIITDADELVGCTFELAGYLGPQEDWDGWPGPEFEPLLLARPVFHVVADGDGLALVSELSAEVFTYAERLPLRRSGDAWLVENLTTSVHTAWTSDAYWTTADYKAALAILVFADDGGDGSATRVVVAASNGYEGDTEREDTSDVTVRGPASGVATSQGQRSDTQAVRATDVSDRIPLGEEMNVPDLEQEPSDVVGFGLQAVFAIEPPVAADSAFHLENAEGARAEVSRIVKNGFVYGVWPRDSLAEGWKLLGSGADIDGQAFELSQPVDIVQQARGSGDFETGTEWIDPCRGQSQALTSYEGKPAIAGTRSLHVEGCPRFRLARAPGATELELDAAVFGYGPDPARVWISVTAMAPQGSTLEAQHVFGNGDVQTVAVALPPEEGDVLVTIWSSEGEIWLDSLRTE